MYFYTYVYNILMHACCKNREGDIHALRIRLHMYIQIGIEYSIILLSEGDTAPILRGAYCMAHWNQKKMAGFLAVCWHARANTVLRVLSFCDSEYVRVCVQCIYIALPISCSSTRRRAMKKKENRSGKRRRSWCAPKNEWRINWLYNWSRTRTRRNTQVYGVARGEYIALRYIFICIYVQVLAVRLFRK